LADLDEVAASRNLRVDLSQLLSVPAPDRAEGSASYFLRTEADRLHFAGEG